MAKKKTDLDKLLDKVKLVENADQEDAATCAVDRLTRSATVTVNPDHLDAEGQHKAQLRGLGHLILSGFGAYNRDITRKYGVFPKEQQVHDQAYDEALAHLDTVLHAALPYEAPAPAPAQPPAKAE